MSTTTTAELPVFDFATFIAAADEVRRGRRLTWFIVADELWDQSPLLNDELHDRPLCGGAVSRLGARGETSCQYAMYLFRWLDRVPEDFLVGPRRDVGDTVLPVAGPDARLRWDLALLYAELDDERRSRGLTWPALAVEIGCTPSRLTNLKTARMADLALVMRITQWLRRPAAHFVVAASRRHRPELL